MNDGTPAPLSDEERRRQIAALQAQLAALQADQGLPAGGASFAAPVQVDGNLAGRDYLQTIVLNIHGASPTETRRIQLALQTWLDALTNQLARPDLGTIDPGTPTQQRAPLELADIYVPLNTTFQIPKGGDLAQMVSTLAAQDGQASGSRQHPDQGRAAKAPRGKRPAKVDEVDEVEREPASALQALDAHPALTLLGLGGSGKSTFGAHVLLAHARALQGAPGLADSLGPAARHGPLLPLRVVLRRFAEQHAQTAGDLTPQHLWQHMAGELAACGWGSESDVLRDVQTLAREHGAFILFDGLDECGAPDRIQRVMAVVQRFISDKSAGRLSRHLLTARPHAVAGSAQPSAGVYELAKLDASQIESFVQRWYDALARRGWMAARTAQGLCADLLAACQHRDVLAPVTETPLLLTMTALLHSNSKRLPDDRADLYDHLVQLLLERWGSDTGLQQALLDKLAVPNLRLADIRPVLQRVAFEVHQAHVGLEGCADISETRLIEALRPLLLNSRDKAAQMLDFIQQRAGLLVAATPRPRAVGTLEPPCYQTPHRSFQEFLAACHLAQLPNAAVACAGLYATADGHWRDVLALAARKAGAPRGAGAAHEVLRGRDAPAVGQGTEVTEDDWTRALVAGLMLAEIGHGALVSADCTTRQILEKAQRWLLAGMRQAPGPGTHAPQRAAMGRVLAKLEDPRFDPQRLYLPAEDDLGFERIQADPGFRIGTHPADAARVKAATGSGPDKDELNDQPTPSPAFWIGRYAVTVAQFEAYLRDTQQAWPDARSARDPRNAPVRWVNWYDAKGYTRWLERQLAEHPLIATRAADKLTANGTLLADLPTDLEWEKAARSGRVGTVFPWGDEVNIERANVRASGISGTAPVGSFPPNDYGLHDMVGNLWEWTASDWTDQVSRWADPVFRRQAEAQAAARDNSAHDKSPKLVRGGSWFNSFLFARCAIRYRSLPVNRHDLIGFRVVLRSSPVRSAAP